MGVQRQSPRVSRRRTCGRRGVTTRHGPMQRIPAPARRRREVRPPWGRSSVVFLSAGALRLPAVIKSSTPMGSAASLSVRCRSARTTSPPPHTLGTGRGTGRGGRFSAARGPRCVTRGPSPGRSMGWISVSMGWISDSMGWIGRSMGCFRPVDGRFPRPDAGGVALFCHVGQAMWAPSVRPSPARTGGAGGCGAPSALFGGAGVVAIFWKKPALAPSSPVHCRCGASGALRRREAGASVF